MNSFNEKNIFQSGIRYSTNLGVGSTFHEKSVDACVQYHSNFLSLLLPPLEIPSSFKNFFFFFFCISDPTHFRSVYILRDVLLGFFLF